MTNPLNWFSQVGSVTRFSLQSIPQRKGASLAAAFGIAGVVAVLVGVLSIAQGFRHAMIAGGSPDTAIVMRSGADSEMMSILSGESTRTIADAPHISRGPEGPLASAELFAVIDLPKRSTGTSANVPLRGVQGPAFKIRDDLRIVQGRRFEPGKNEIIVGVGAAREFAGLTLGKTIKVGRNDWSVVGIFSANGSLPESEIWTDASVLQAAYQRGNSFQAVYVKLTSPEAYQAFKEGLAKDPRVNVKIITEREYYEGQSKMVYNMINTLGTGVALLMAIAAIFGALNTMYSAVSSRTREIATLRALGFGRSPVVLSVLIEAITLAAVGGGLGAIGAYLAFDGYHASTLNWQSFSQVTFAFAVTPKLLVLGVGLAVAIGFVGGFFPAIRAARLPVASALREL